MKNKNIKNSNGIAICDSIIMSVKKKRPNFRVIEAVFISVCGFAATIMSFFSMFDFEYNKPALIFAAILFSAVYITLSLMGKRGIWIAAGSAFIAMFACYRYIEKLALGFKFVYNRIYSAAYHTDISYYKFLKPDLEANAVTTFFVLYVWALALVLYIFTIYRPNSIPPLIVTFPVLEVGLYNGMKVSVLWGMLLVAYWLALFAMTTIDIGEYSGGSGGFVRKENLFFPKRQMRLKVTEKCGVMIIAEVLAITAVTVGTMKLLDYKRSDELNRKRSDVRDAVNSFTIDDIAGSVSNITSAFGFTFTTDTHKLGNVDRLRYKDTTDLVVTVNRRFDGAIYLKEFTGVQYNSDEWTAFADSVYSDRLFDSFRRYSVHPQDFPYTMDRLISPNDEDYTIRIKSNLRNNRSFAPYGTHPLSVDQYNYDKDVASKRNELGEFFYSFSPYSPDDIVFRLGKPTRMVCYPDRIDDEAQRENIVGYCRDNDLLLDDDSENFTISPNVSISPSDFYDYPDAILTQIMEEQYEDFVYEHYLQVPDTTEMAEIRTEFAPLLGDGSKKQTAREQIDTLDALRSKVNTMAEYSLTPGRTPNNRDFVNYFLFENHKGYCTHYASAGVILARMAGIPARYATGYVIVGDDFDEAYVHPAFQTYKIDVKDNRSHAWVEVYLSGYGWVPYEFTAGYSAQSIDTTPTTAATTEANTDSTTTTAVTETTSGDTTTNTRRPQSSTTANATTTAAMTSASTTAVSTGGAGIGRGGSLRHIAVSPAVKYTFYTILLIAAFIGAALLRRALILWLRRKHLTEGEPAKRMRYIYGYAEKLLGIMDIKREGESLMEFAAKVDRALGGRLFPEGSFTACTDAALRAAFSEEVPDKAEAEAHMKFVSEFAKKLYAESKPLRRFWLKFINVIQ
ncbi:MAG: transglutaminase-like domain-containing protein [Ruminococcus sp.]|nr:transglutaminase-like domain-containing protein [Ruminococcus sp.]